MARNTICMDLTEVLRTLIHGSGLTLKQYVTELEVSLERKNEHYVLLRLNPPGKYL